MQVTLVSQIMEHLRPYGMYSIPEDPGEPIVTKRGGRIQLTETIGGLTITITRKDGRVITATRPADDPGKLALSVRVINGKARG